MTRVVVLVDRTEHGACRHDQVVDGTGAVAGDDAVFGLAIIQQLVLHGTRPHRRGVDGAIEQAAVAARRQAPLQFQLEIAVRADTEDVAATGFGEHKFVVADLPARIQRGAADTAPLRRIGERLPGRCRRGRAAGDECGQQDRHDPQAAHAQSTTRQNTALR